MVAVSLSARSRRGWHGVVTRALPIAGPARRAAIVLDGAPAGAGLPERLSVPILVRRRSFPVPRQPADHRTGGVGDNRSVLSDPRRAGRRAPSCGVSAARCADMASEPSLYRRGDAVARDDRPKPRIL